jgi:hypothetical protein
MNENKLKELIAKFYEGTSTDDEERELRAYFSGGDILPGYEAERDIFPFLSESAEIPDPDPGFEARIITAIDKEEAIRKNKILRRIILPSLSVAAGLLILAGSYFYFSHQAVPVDTFTDPQLAYAETVRILYDVSARMNNARRTLQPVGKINSVREQTISSLNKPALVIGRNLRTLDYLKNNTEPGDTSGDQ